MSDYDIAPFLDRYGVDYRPSRGGNQPIRCPNGEAHKNGDRTPSASLHLDKSLWKCQSCGAGGSAIDLIMLCEGVDIGEAFAIAEGCTPEGSRQVPREPGRSELGLPQKSRVHRGHGGPVSPWKGFRT